MFKRTKSGRKKFSKGESSAAVQETSGGGRIESWFNGNQEKMDLFIHEISRKQINISKVVKFSWLDAEGFRGVRKLLQHQKLQKFLELNGRIYPDLIKVFFTNLSFEGSTLKTQVKGVEIEITPTVWKNVAGLKDEGVKVTKGYTSDVEEFNKVQYFRSCMRNKRDSMSSFNTGKLNLEERILAFIVA